MSRRPIVAVIGAGFSGLLTALRLLATRADLQVLLIERAAHFGQGPAYRTTNPDHLLNVRAANMSALPEDSAHFLRWIERQDSGAANAADGRSFVTRAKFGEYLQSLLRDAIAHPDAAGRLLLEADAVVGLAPTDAGWRLDMAMGRRIEADAVVLAVGNLPPRPPCEIGPGVMEPGRYVADPWAWDPKAAPETGTAVLLGSGLTMVDVALSLAARRPDLCILSVSRRGLLPQRHMPSGPGPADEAKPEGGVTTVLRRLRLEANQRDWQALVDGLRPHVQSIWRDWSLAERSRFLRHARPWWDIHRHRLAPAVAEKIHDLVATGRLTVAAGRVREVTRISEADDSESLSLKVAWTVRGTRDQRATAAALVINCTGPQGDLARSGDPLLSSLSRQGLIRSDRNLLGVEVDNLSRLIGLDGHSNRTLFAVGPITRGAFWEITSVPDIRVQAADCAAHILDGFGPP